MLGRLSLRPGSLGPRLRPFDLLLANISRQVLVALARPLARAARPGAVLVASGFLAEGRRAVEHALRGAGWHPVETLAAAGWRTLVARKG